MKANVGLQSKDNTILKKVWDKYAKEIAIDFDRRLIEDLTQAGLLDSVTFCDKEPALIRSVKFDDDLFDSIQEVCGYCVIERYEPINEEINNQLSEVDDKIEQLVMDLWEDCELK